jgi:hypothetical protein
MSRRYAYMLYAALWTFTIWMFYYLKPYGGGAFVTFGLYGFPVFLLYLFSLFLMDCREDVIDKPLVMKFFRRRRFSIFLFFLGLAILILLMSRTSAV